MGNGGDDAGQRLSIFSLNAALWPWDSSQGSQSRMSQIGILAAEYDIVVLQEVFQMSWPCGCSSYIDMRCVLSSCLCYLSFISHDACIFSGVSVGSRLSDHRCQQSTPLW